MGPASSGTVSDDRDKRNKQIAVDLTAVTAIEVFTEIPGRTQLSLNQHIQSRYGLPTTTGQGVEANETVTNILNRQYSRPAREDFGRYLRRQGFNLE